MATVLITGGTGLIGKALSKELLKKKYEVIILTRSPGKHRAVAGITYASWNIQEKKIDATAMAKADFIIHLAGAGVGDKRWTVKRKNELVESRTLSSALIVAALKENANHVKAVISASAIGWYGAGTRERPFEETDPPATDFLGTTCKEWEASIGPVTSLGKRLVILRTGIVLSKEGGVLDEFKKPLRFGLATILGNGKQVMSWIHIEDLVRLYIFSIENERLKGVYNAVAPHPVTNKKLVYQLARHMKGTFFVTIYVPSVILKIILGEMSIEVLKSATVSCKKIKIEGFSFLNPSIIAAIHHSIEGPASSTYY
jgi:uncharacterized protein (TIGR01777 family)